MAAFVPNYFRTIHHKCSNTIVLSISHMKLFKRTKKLELNLHIEFGRAVLSTIFVSRRKLWNHSSNPCSKRRDKNHPILSSYPVRVEKISIQRRGRNCLVLLFIPSHFSYKQPLWYETLKYDVVTGLACCHFYGNVWDVLHLFNWTEKIILAKFPPLFQ